MMEKIGEIAIDSRHYPGQDLYCDGAVEDVILDIVKHTPSDQYAKVIEEKAQWPILYHLSPLRENIVSWLPIDSGDKVLEVGSGCGAITGALAARAESVTCVELSRKRSLINAYRHAHCANVTIKLGNFQDVEPELAKDYDYIFLIGVFEYAFSYIGGEKPFETFMGIMLNHLSKDGRLIIAIENRFGLKYWAGCREDHLGDYFSGIEGYPEGGGVRTFTRKGLEEICRKNKAEEYAFYYPYPDYKFMTNLYSDKRLPRKGELADNFRNFDRDRLLLFDEKNVFDSLIEEEMFPSFSNSYLLVVGKPLDVEYVRFSNDRAPAYAIRTEIRDQGESRQVRKIPLTKEAQAHVKRLKDSWAKLEEEFAGWEEKNIKIKLNKCELDDGEAVFAYIEGKTLEEILDERVERQDREGFEALVEQYRRVAEYPRYRQVIDYDLVFSNIIIRENTWHIIDYEWTFPVQNTDVRARELVARALYCYGLGSEKRKKLSHDYIKERLDYTRKEFDRLVEREYEFQKMSTGNRMSSVEIRNRMAHPIIPAVKLAHTYVEGMQRNRIQIYEDLGQGFSEENSYFYGEAYGEKEWVLLEADCSLELQAVRIDPSLDYCVVTVDTLSVNHIPVSLREKNILLNGKLISENTIVFPTDDPGITLGITSKLREKALQGGQKTGFHIRMRFSVLRVTKEMADKMVSEGGKKRKIIFGKGLS